MLQCPQLSRPFADAFAQYRRAEMLAQAVGAHSDSEDEADAADNALDAAAIRLATLPTAGGGEALALTTLAFERMWAMCSADRVDIEQPIGRYGEALNLSILANAIRALGGDPWVNVNDRLPEPDLGPEFLGRIAAFEAAG